MLPPSFTAPLRPALAQVGAGFYFGLVFPNRAMRRHGLAPVTHGR